MTLYAKRWAVFKRIISGPHVPDRITQAGLRIDIENDGIVVPANQFSPVYVLSWFQGAAIVPSRGESIFRLSIYGLNGEVSHMFYRTEWSTTQGEYTPLRQY